MNETKREQKDPDLSLNLFGLHWKNPITTASGTFSPKDSGAFYDLSALGALTTKGVSYEPWEGNSTPRIAETYGGLLNAVGLQNPGVFVYMKEELPYLLQFQTNIIANMAGHTIEEYVKVAEALDETEVQILELNISCPNVALGGMSFGTDPHVAAAVTKAVRAVTKKPITVKLSPNVTDITEIARAVEGEGADGISLINTLQGMKIDVFRGRPVLANKIGGFSGPAVKPVAVRMVYQVRRAVNLPIIGMGGIMTGEDAAEFIMAGADALAVGSASFSDPCAPVRILGELRAFMKEQGYETLKELRDAFCG